MKLEYFHRNPVAIKIGVALIAMLLIIIPLRNTIALSFKYGGLKASVRTYQNSNRMISQAKTNGKLLEEFDHEKKIFEAVSQACQEHRVIVKQVDLPKAFNNAEVVIQSQEILLEGDYINILKSLRDINVELEPIKISNIKFEREENNKRIALVAHIVFQSVKLEDENEK